MVTGGGEEGIGTITVAALEVVAVHAMLGLGGLHRGVQIT